MHLFLYTSTSIASFAGWDPRHFPWYGPGHRSTRVQAAQPRQSDICSSKWDNVILHRPSQQSLASRWRMQQEDKLESAALLRDSYNTFTLFICPQRLNELKQTQQRRSRGATKAEPWQQKGGRVPSERVPIKRLLTFSANGEPEHPIGNAPQRYVPISEVPSLDLLRRTRIINDRSSKHNKNPTACTQPLSDKKVSYHLVFSDS